MCECDDRLASINEMVIVPVGGHVFTQEQQKDPVGHRLHKWSGICTGRLYRVGPYRRCGGTKSAIAALPIAKFALNRPIIARLTMASQRSVKKPRTVEKTTVTRPPDNRNGLRP